MDSDDDTESVTFGWLENVAATAGFVACSLPSQPYSTIEIDKDGDLTLVVGQTKCERGASGSHIHLETVAYLICSRTLARSSPVMNAMLLGGFHESRQSTISLPEDNPKAMKIILDMVHGNFDCVPHTCDGLCVEDLYQITVLTDKYAMTQKLRPWVRAWSICVNTWLHKPKTSRLTMGSFERLLWIVSEFGHRQFFEAGVDLMAHNLNASRNLFKNSLEPQDTGGNNSPGATYLEEIAT